jgi:hypothetical protein
MTLELGQDSTLPAFRYAHKGSALRYGYGNCSDKNDFRLEVELSTFPLQRGEKRCESSRIAGH